MRLILQRMLVVLVIVVMITTTFNWMQVNSNQSCPIALIGPHHDLVEHDLYQFYEETLSGCAYQQIVIVSPNHYGFGRLFIDTWESKSPERQREHGIALPDRFFSKLFPKERIMAITLKFGTPAETIEANVAQTVAGLPERTLLVASVDFTHNELEAVAVANDERTVDYLSQTDLEEYNLADLTELAESQRGLEFDAVSFDSPEAVYYLAEFLEKIKPTAQFKLVERTSTYQLLGIDQENGSVSHVYGLWQ